MNANEQQTIILPAGQALTLTVAAGTTGSVVRLSRIPAAGNAQSVTAIAGLNLVFGPYAQPERFQIICTTGTVALSIAVPEPANMTLRAQGKTPVNAVAASGKLVSTGTRVSDGEKVTIGTTVYTFKTALTNPAVAYEVLIGANTGAQATNLVAAIMGTAGAGSTYGTGTVAHPLVSAAVADTDDVALTAKTKGVAGNAIATSDDSDQLSWAETAETLEGGIDGTVGVTNEICADDSYLYHCIGANTITGANWRRIARGNVY